MAAVSTGWFERGLSAGKQGQDAEAHRCFNKAAELAPELKLKPQLHANIGRSLNSLQRWEEAIPHFETALRLDSASHTPCCTWARLSIG